MTTPRTPTALLTLTLAVGLGGCLEVDTSPGAGDDGASLDGSGPSLSGGLGFDSSGNVDGYVEAELGRLETATAQSDAASLDLSTIADVRLLGYATSPEFHRGEPIEVSLLPLDSSGHGIIDANVYVSMSVECEVGFGMSGSIRIREARDRRPDLPYQFGIGLDGSGSMTTSDPHRLRVPAGQRFVDTIARAYPGSEFGLVEFDSDVVERSALTGDLDRIQQAMARVSAQGSTRLHDATLTLVQDLAATQDGTHQQAVLLLSDGMDTASTHDEHDALAAARAADIPIHAISLGGALDVSGLGFVGDLQKYAYETGGLFVHVDAADQLERSFENLALGATEGEIVLDVTLAGGIYLPFSSCTVHLDVHAGGATAQTSFALVMPLN